MNEREFASRLKQNLNYGLGQLPPAVLARLRSARERALEACILQEAVNERYALPGQPHPGTRGAPTGARRWLSLAMLIAALAGAIYWQTQMQGEQDVDAAILGGELPLNAYLDHDFHSWIERSSQP